jgi:hypothetical protein
MEKKKKNIAIEILGDIKNVSIDDLTRNERLLLVMIEKGSNLIMYIYLYVYTHLLIFICDNVY